MGLNCFLVDILWFVDFYMCGLFDLDMIIVDWMLLEWINDVFDEFCKGDMMCSVIIFL